MITLFIGENKIVEFLSGELRRLVDNPDTISTLDDGNGEMVLSFDPYTISESKQPLLYWWIAGVRSGMAAALKEKE